MNSQNILKTLGISSLLFAIPPDPTLQSLGKRLSPKASIVLSASPAFEDLTKRWHACDDPDITAVVQAHNELDVIETIRHANEHSRPFLAMSGGHGGEAAMATMKDGIQIDLRAMNHTHIAANGKSAVVGGGTSVKQLGQFLWDHGKETVHGICECVSVAGPLLGGGHGWLQGKYGLAADQLLSARVVLSNGTAVVASENENPGLFWALRGAGHNFGIVTEMELRVYDLPVSHPDWSYRLLFFSHDRAEALFQLAEEIRATQPSELTLWTYILKLPFSTVHPTIAFYLIHQGPATVLDTIAEPFDALEPIGTERGTTTMPGLAAVTMQDLDGAGCARTGKAVRQHAIILDRWNATAVAMLTEDFGVAMRNHPGLNASVMLFEGSPVQGVMAVRDGDTAFPHRERDVLVTSFVMYDPTDEELTGQADKLGERLRGHLAVGDGVGQGEKRLRAYVNYANGREGREAVYGWEGWRLQKLRNLKAEWDPLNRMRFYHPIL